MACIVWQTAEYGAVAESAEIPDDVPVFALFNASKHIRLPDKIDHALHCPVALRLTATSLDFRQIKGGPSGSHGSGGASKDDGFIEGITRARTERGEELPHPTAQWQSIQFADVVYVKAYSEPCEDPGKTAMQLGIPAAFRVNWCPRVPKATGCCSGGDDTSADRVFASAIFVFGTSPLAPYDQDTDSEEDEIKEEDDAPVEGAGDVKASPVPVDEAAAHNKHQLHKNLVVSRQWALKVFQRAFPDRYQLLQSRLPTPMISRTGSRTRMSEPDLKTDAEALTAAPAQVVLTRDVSSDIISAAGVKREKGGKGKRFHHHHHRSDRIEVSMSSRRKLLVFINPVGGQGKAVQIYEHEIAPLFQHARIEAEVVGAHPRTVLLRFFAPCCHGQARWYAFMLLPDVQ